MSLEPPVISSSPETQRKINHFFRLVYANLTLVLFGIMLFIQVLWLYPIYQFLEYRALTDISHTGVAVFRALIDVTSGTLSKQKFLELANTVIQDTPLKGVRIAKPDGEEIISFGEKVDHNPYLLYDKWSDWMTGPLDDGTRFEITWLPKRTTSPNFVVARLDCSMINDELTEDMWTIFMGMLITSGISALVIAMVLRRSLPYFTVVDVLD